MPNIIKTGSGFQSNLPMQQLYAADDIRAGDFVKCLFGTCTNLEQLFGDAKLSVNYIEPAGNNDLLVSWWNTNSYISLVRIEDNIPKVLSTIAADRYSSRKPIKVRENCWLATDTKYITYNYYALNAKVLIRDGDHLSLSEEPYLLGNVRTSYVYDLQLQDGTTLIYYKSNTNIYILNVSVEDGIPQTLCDANVYVSSYDNYYQCIQLQNGELIFAAYESKTASIIYRLTIADQRVTAAYLMRVEGRPTSKNFLAPHADNDKFWLFTELDEQRFAHEIHPESRQVHTCLLTYTDTLQNLYPLAQNLLMLHTQQGYERIYAAKLVKYENGAFTVKSEYTFGEESGLLAVLDNGQIVCVDIDTYTDENMYVANHQDGVLQQVVVSALSCQPVYGLATSSAKRSQMLDVYIP